VALPGQSDTVTVTVTVGGPIRHSDTLPGPTRRRAASKFESDGYRDTGATDSDSDRDHGLCHGQPDSSEPGPAAAWSARCRGRGASPVRVRVTQSQYQ
jgi:hypothetical protein